MLNVWWTVPPAWLSQQSTDDVECLQRRVDSVSSETWKQMVIRTLCMYCIYVMPQTARYDMRCLRGAAVLEVLIKMSQVLLAEQ